MHIIEHTSGLVPGPGIYRMPAELYHSDPAPEPSLSASVAKVLIERTPKHAWALHPRLGNCAKEKPTREMDIGSVAHEMLLGHGGGYVISPHDEYRTNAAKAWRDDVLAAGKTPIKLEDYDAAGKIVEAIDDAIFRKRIVSTPGGDHHTEIVLVWQEPSGVWCRAMLDWVTPDGTVYDPKTRAAIGDRAIRTWIAEGLDVQAAFHTRGLVTLVPELEGRTRWVWIFVERSEPYAVRAVEADATTLHMGARKVAYAMSAWLNGMHSGQWPAYPDKIETIEYASWAESAWLERELAEAAQ